MRWFTPAVLLLLAWGALAFGAEYAWAYFPLLIASVAVAAAVFAAGVPAPRTSNAVPAALLALAAAGALQATPLPERLVAAVSPARAAHDYSALVGMAVPGPPAAASGATPGTLSVRPSRTLLGLAFLAAFGAFHVACLRALPVVTPVGAARGLIALGIVVALVVIAQQGSGADRVYGFWLPRYQYFPAAPFLNRHHAAGWLVMTLSVVLGYFCGQVADLARRPATARGRWLASRDASEMIIAGFAILLMSAALVFTFSRSGLGALAAALGLTAVWVVRRQASRHARVLIPLGLVLMLAVAIVWAGAADVGRELAPDGIRDDALGRIAIWSDTLRIIADFPLAGTGLNTYGIAMLAYQTAAPGVHLVEAHNDYLQLAAEGGLLLGFPTVAAILLFVREVRRRFREAADRTVVYWVRVGAVTGLLAIALQSVVDFSLQMPGNAVLFALLLAIAAHRAPARSNA